ncbi:MAG: trypsin-like peptidase domain-containing protein [Candidatus Hydrogenedentes bacterium]|nr:trypsin-like peptidase domain-containing protein [Candidatus Hydrogenedentota bacterium]
MKANSSRYSLTHHNFRAWLLLAASTCLLGMTADADVQESITTSRRNAIVTAIESVSPAVVTINVVELHVERSMDPFFEEFWGMFGERFERPYARQHAVESIGSGFIFTPEGHILTNYHVVQNASAISSVSLPDGRTLDVAVAGVDERTDIAVLKAKDAKDLPHIPLGNSEDLMVGEWVIAIGNPFGNLMTDPQPSVSVGVVSANHRRVARDVGGDDRSYQDLIQTDAAINPGNSGGPLVNAQGQVVGMNTMIFSNSGGNQGLGFAIPASRIQRVVDDVLRFGRRRNPWMGFRGEAVQELTDYSLQQLDVRAGEGVLVTEILKTSPAFEAGLRLGDVITQVNREPVTHPVEVDYINWGLFVGDPVTLTINRAGKSAKVNFNITELVRE